MGCTHFPYSNIGFDAKFEARVNPNNNDLTMA